MKMIFHHPGPFHQVLDTGQKKRPKKMKEAFQNLGYEVIEFVGTRKQRENKFHTILSTFDACDFVYSENSTLPLALTEPHHLPKWPLIDSRFIDAVHRHQIPLGVFYRDIYWKFPHSNRSINWLKNLLAKPFYQYELWLYAQKANVLFIPSKAFSELIPQVPCKKKIELPPGGDPIDDIPSKPRTELKLAYVGAVVPPVYDISLLLEEMARIRDLPIKCDVYVRKSQWEENKSFYCVPSNVKIHHLSGDQLRNKLKYAHLSIQYFPEDSYRKICKPLKLFEALSLGIPVISNGDNAASQYIKQNKLGWVIEKDNITLGLLLKDLLENREELERTSQMVANRRFEHSWEKRAEKVMNCLGTVNKSSK